MKDHAQSTRPGPVRHVRPVYCESNNQVSVLCVSTPPPPCTSALSLARSRGICPESCRSLSRLSSKPLPLFNRCTPVNISCYTRFAEAVVTFVSDNSMLHSLVAGVVASKEVILGLCVLALGSYAPPTCSVLHCGLTQGAGR